jgi:hypothetical protein
MPNVIRRSGANAADKEEPFAKTFDRGYPAGLPARIGKGFGVVRLRVVA